MGNRLLETLAHYACRDSARVNEGLNLLLAYVVAADSLSTSASEPAMALAKLIAASPKDTQACDSWTPLLAL